MVARGDERSFYHIHHFTQVLLFYILISESCSTNKQKLAPTFQNRLKEEMFVFVEPNEFKLRCLHKHLNFINLSLCLIVIPERLCLESRTLFFTKFFTYYPLCLILEKIAIRNMLSFIFIIHFYEACLHVFVYKTIFKIYIHVCVSWISVFIH